MRDGDSSSSELWDREICAVADSPFSYTASEMDFFTEYGEGSRYKIEEVIGKGSYGVVCSALDTHTGEKVAIKKINDIFEHYTPAIDIWSIGCIFAELLTGKPLFPGKNVVHQLDIITDLLGTPSPEAISRIRNEKARRYLSTMRRKRPIPFTQKFPNADPLALNLLERMLAFEPKDRPSAEEALADPYFKNIANVDREPSAQTVTKLEFEFERRRVTKDDIRELIYREILEYHPNMLREFLEGTESSGFMYPRNTMLRDLQEFHLRGNITHCHGDAARPSKAAGSVLQYNPCPSSAPMQYEQRRAARHPAMAPNNIPSGSSYPRRNQTCKSETGDAERMDVNQAGQPKPYAANKLPATVDGRGGHW
nr:unnamed protein product [Digitaria exilis]